MTATFKAVFIVLLAVLPMWLGGGTPDWAVALGFSMGGTALILLRHRIIFRKKDLLFAGVLLGWCLLTSLWPHALTVGDSWRTVLPESRTGYLPFTHSPQPWLSLESILVLGLGAAWFLSLRGIANTSILRYPVYVGLIAALTFTGVIAYLENLGHFDLPFWENNSGMGPFANRNQFACVLAIGTTVAGGLSLQDSRRRPVRSVLWLVALIFFLFLIVLNGSKAGLLLSLVGFLAIGTGEFILNPKSDRFGRILAFTFLTVATLMFLGGLAVERLLESISPGSEFSSSARWLIQQDVLAMILQQPLYGIGFGQFETLFPLFQEGFTAYKRVVHPESDWLWLWAESGLPVLCILGYWAYHIVRDAYPVKRGRGRRLRWTGMVAGGLLFLHGWFDVSGHRPGTAFLGLLCLALSASHERIPVTIRNSRLVTAVGVLFYLYGAAMFLTRASLMQLPGSITSHRVVEEAAYHLKEETLDSDLLDRYLKAAPLSSRLHYIDGVFHLYHTADIERAESALDTARLIDPHNLDLLSMIATAWAGKNLDQTIRTWEQILEHDPSESGRYVSRIVSSAPDSLYRDALWMMSIRYPILIYPLVRTTTPEELMRWQNRIVATPPSSHPSHNRDILHVWSSQLGLKNMITILEESETWKVHAWPYVARWKYEQGAVVDAVNTFRTNLKFDAQSLPAIDEKTALKARKRLLRDPDDDLSLLQVSVVRYQQRQYRALLEGCQPLMNSKAPQPPYLYWIAGQAACETEQWEEAYQYFERYDRETQRQAGNR
jgi:hypothetical protein